MINANRTISLVEIPAAGKGGFIWNRLHTERESLCENLLNDSTPLGDGPRELLQARLRQLDDALDRLMAGSYGNCSRCGRPIDPTRLDTDPALGVCGNCRRGEHGAVSSTDKIRESKSEVMLQSLSPFDSILMRTYNSDYHILLLDPKTGRALVEGGSYLAEPSEAFLRGSMVPGSEFKAGSLAVGSRVEIWIDEKVFITSLVKSVHVQLSDSAEFVEDISPAVH